MTMERMGSREGRAEMEQEIDALAHIRISGEISTLAEKASDIAKQLEGDNLSEIERTKLSEEIKECVEKGSALTQKRNQIQARLGV